MDYTLPSELLDYLVSEDADAIHSRMLGKVREYDGDTDTQVGSPAWDATRPGSLEIEELQKQINDGIAAAIPLLSFGPFLEEHVKSQRLTRKPGAKATGILTLEATVDVTIEEGTTVWDAADRRFVVQDTVSILPPSEQPDPDDLIPGTATVTVVAEDFGLAYNVSPYTIRFIDREYEGLVSIRQAAAMTGGLDAETDDELKERYLIAIRNQSGAGNLEDYKGWALSVNGVYAAQPLRATPGPGSVTVVIASQEGVPDAELVAEVQDAIDARANLVANNIVEAAQPLTLNLTGTLSLQPDAVEADVLNAYTQAVNAYLRPLYFSGEPVRYSQLYQLLVTTEGVMDVEGFLMNGSTVNLTPAEREIPILGTVMA